jgi:hypothetical protein
MIRHLVFAVILISTCSGCSTKIGMMSARHRLTAPFTALVVEGPYKTKQDVITTDEDLQLTIDQVPEHPVPEDPNNWNPSFPRVLPRWCDASHDHGPQYTAGG